MDDILFTIRVCFQTGSFQEKCCKQKKRPICETSRFNNIYGENYKLRQAHQLRVDCHQKFVFDIFFFIADANVLTFFK